MDMVLCAKTLGRRPGCIVMNIGAVMFDRTGHDRDYCLRPESQFYQPISGFDSHSHNFHALPETLRWWKKQPSWQLVGEEFMNSTTTVRTACENLAEFIATNKPDKIWCNSPTFHVAVINALFDKVGMQRPIPYRSEMDYRTLMDLVYVNRDSRPDAHDAVDGYPKQHAVGDAIAQARSITRAIREMDSTSGILLNDQKWVMLDIETLGRRPGCGIMTIGATRFDAMGSRDLVADPKGHFYCAINSFDCANKGFTTDNETLKFWKGQPIWNDLSAEIRDSATSTKMACMQLAEYLEQQNADKIWSNSPSFDVDILRFMFEKMGVPFPVAYRQETDYRTVMELAFPNRDDRPAPEFRDSYPPHHALGDAMDQAIQINKALVQLGLVAESSLDDRLSMSTRRRSARISR